MENRIAYLKRIIKEPTSTIPEALTCNKCNTLAAIETPAEFDLYFSYDVKKDEAALITTAPKVPPENGVYPYVNVSAAASALVSVTFTCPCCGYIKLLQYKATPFECHIEQKNVHIKDYEHVRKMLETSVEAIIKEYNDPKRRKHIPYTFTSTKNPNFENRFKLKESAVLSTHPEYKGVIIDYHKDIEKMLEHYFVLNEIDGNAQLIDPSNTLIKQLFKCVKTKRATQLKNEFQNPKRKVTERAHAKKDPKQSRDQRIARSTPYDSATSERSVPTHKGDIENPIVHNTVSHRNSEPQRPQSNLGAAVDQPALHQSGDVHSRRKPPEEKSSGGYSSSSSRVPNATSRGKHSNGRYSKAMQRNSRKTTLIIIVLCIVLILFGLGYVFLTKAPRKETTVITPTESVPAQSETATKQETDEAEEIKDNPPIQEKKLNINEYVGYWRISDNKNKELTILSGDGNSVHFSLWYAAKGKITDASAQLQDNIASFSLAVDGAVIKGILTFHQNAIAVQITHSTHATIPVEAMEFTELYMTSQAYSEEIEAIAETENASISAYSFKIKDDFHGIYSGPSYESSYVKDMPTGKYTIVEERYDDRSNLWGKLESGTGWICLTGINESKPTAGYLLPFSSVRLLTEKDISSLTTSELRFARNEIFARHGRLFDDKGLQDYFNKKAWYSGYIKPADFSESMLSDIELKNVAFIRSHQQSASSNTESEDVTEQQTANAAWQSAYLGYIEALKPQENYSFKLVYVDADNVPELIINGPDGTSGSDVFSYKGGRLVQQYLDDGYFIPESGLVYSHYGRMGYYPTEIYRLNSTGFTVLFEGLQQERCVVDENGEEQFVFEYTIDGLIVSEDEFNTAVEELFDFSEAAPTSGHALSYQQVTLEILHWK